MYCILFFWTWNCISRHIILEIFVYVANNAKIKLQPNVCVLFKKLIQILDSVHGNMNSSDLLQSKWSPKGFTLILQETRSIHGSKNIPKTEFIAYINILL